MHGFDTESKDEMAESFGVTQASRRLDFRA
jgi:hypothetical protein